MNPEALGVFWVIRGLSFCSATHICLAVLPARQPIYPVDTISPPGSEARDSEANASTIQGHPQRTQFLLPARAPRHLARALLQAHTALPTRLIDPGQGTP